MKEQCDTCPHLAVVVLYPGKREKMLLCGCCFEQVLNHGDKSVRYAVVPLTLRGFHAVHRKLYHEVDSILNEAALTIGMGQLGGPERTAPGQEGLEPPPRPL